MRFLRSVQTRCSVYNENVSTWMKCRDVVSGERAVKAKGEIYLPRPDGMGKDEYEAYLLRAGFFNATGRTLDGLHGMLFRTPITIEANEKDKQFLANVDGKNNTLDQFVSDVAYDLLITGFGGVLIDAPSNTNALSLREAEETEAYPYLVQYRAEDIINWRFEPLGRRQKLSLVVLKENYQKVLQDGFSTENRTRYRVLDIYEGAYRQRIFEDEGLSQVSEVFPTKYGKTLDYIPFYFLPAKTPEKPMLYDLVSVNLSWFRKSAYHENGLMYISVPAPYTIGWTPPDYDSEGNKIPEHQKRDIKLSCAKFIHFPEGVSAVGMLEYTGAGMGAIATAMEKDEERMAILGARIISAEKRGVEATETAKIHRAGENSVLATFANNLSDSFSKIIKDYLQWTENNENVEVSIRLNTDYDVAGMNGAELTAFVSAWQNGAISKRVMFNNLKEGEIIDKEKNFEDMEAEIEEEGLAKMQELNEDKRSF